MRFSLSKANLSEPLPVRAIIAADTREFEEVVRARVIAKQRALEAKHPKPEKPWYYPCA